MDEIRDPSNKFDSNDIVYAAAGVKILAPDVDDVIAGLPIRGVGPDDDIEEIKEQIEEELQAINITTDDDGIILKANALGSLEAATGLFQQEGLKIRKAGVGAISKNDIMEALAARSIDPYSGTVCGFGVKPLKDAELEADNQGNCIITNDVIYQLLKNIKIIIISANPKIPLKP